MILPSGAPPAQAPGPPWSADHLRLHRHLRRQPQLLPAGAGLLVALSGGQDSMALLALLQDLQRLHHWRISLWHGDHRWRPDSARQAAELEAWCSARGLPLHTDVWERGAEASGPEALPSEAAARHWRYAQLTAHARRLEIGRVLTAHTASDRAETLLLHLARGSHRRGLASLRSLRPLAPDTILLARPLLIFNRADTARLCRELDLPVWHDPCNSDRRYSRNRIRAEVLPVLEALHPGAAGRISAQAERLVEEVESGRELLELALQTLAADQDPAAWPGLRRRALVQLAPANQRQLLHHWLEQHTGQTLPARQLEAWLARLQVGQGPGRTTLQGGWQLHWDRCTLRLVPPAG